MLSENSRQEIENKLIQLENSDSTQVVVLTIPTLEEENLEEFSIKVAQKWQIGKNKKDNGVILLVAKQERKVRIEVGRGLEGKLTDLVSGRIIRQEIVPYFREEDYNLGLVAGVNSIIAVVKGEYQGNTKLDSKETSPNWILILVVLLMGFLFFIRRSGGVFTSGGGGSWRSGGGFSGGGGSFGGGGSSGNW
ncbi:MAG: TPM domain-containing protein [Oligoflexia bacterium]|nr:TPM domain-containing protein [Oligoflexia bacterium]